MKEHAREILRVGGVNNAMKEDVLDFSEIKFIVLMTFEDGTITDEELRLAEEEMIIKLKSRAYGYNKTLTHSNGKYLQGEKLYCPDFELMQLKLPKGTRERIKALLKNGESVSDYCLQAIAKNLNL